MKLAPVLLAVALSAALPAFAQWDVKTPNIPRLADGSPDLDAPVPHLPDGRVDLSGIWTQNPTRVRDMAAGAPAGTIQMRPWAEELYSVRASGAVSHLEPDANCLPQGTPKINTAPAPWKLIQYPDRVVILYEAFTQWRQIFLDGRPLPKDPNPTWFGYSVGHWEGDDLVVETTGFNGRVWLDQLGHPSTEQMHVTERFHRKNFGNLDIEVTIDDPVAYKQPFTVVQPFRYEADTELIEFICSENEQDIKHMAPAQ